MTDSKSAANPMWGGHFDKGPHALMQEINASIDVDKRLYRQDIRGSIAHAQMLVSVGMLTAEDGAAMEQGLKEILAEIDAGNFTFTPELEDIHMHVESRLKEKMGDNAGRLHTARSRNDQVATDFRLYVRDALDELDVLLKQLQTVLVKRAEEHAATIMPGFTHLQTAQPVTFGHHLMAYVEMLGRDRKRVASARENMNECPLGAAALAGTSFPINRHMTAGLLDFDAPMRNSLDAVSARDFALEFLSVGSIIATHLSRLAEELVIWSSSPFGFVKMSDSFTSGSSIMPQKRNPDAAELVRAKVGRVTGSLITLLTVMKGLTLAYNKDMQEDKEPLFIAHDQLVICLKVAAGMLEDLQVNAERMRTAAAGGYSTATDLADWLVRTLNMPFRRAHHVTGAVVKIAESKGCMLSELKLSDMQSVDERITHDVFDVLSVEHSAASRTSFGGTAPQNVKQAIVEAKKRFGL